MRMKRKNLENIQAIFARKTGVVPAPTPGVPARRMLILAAALVFCLAMAAFAWPLFSSLDGDELSLRSVYEGNGIVRIHVENRSDKTLRFQEQTKLMRWVTSKEVERLSGAVAFENTTFEPHSGGIMTVDLSKAYNVTALEESKTNGEWFYLLLTNNNFLFGQDWMCSVNFAPTREMEAPEEAPPSVSAETTIAENIREELKFYFGESYGGEQMAFNEANFLYQQKVEELLARFEGTVVPSLSPVIMVGGPSDILDPEPIMGKPPEGTVFDASVPEDRQYLLTISDWTYTDAYGRMVATADEKAWAQTAVLPRYEGDTDGGVTIPIVFLFVYDSELALPENYAFIYGQLHSFADLAQYKVLEDEHYAIYDATDLIYTDLDACLDYFLTTRSDIYCDDDIRQRVYHIREFYREKENIRQMYGYLTFPEP